MSLINKPKGKTKQELKQEIMIFCGREQFERVYLTPRGKETSLSEQFNKCNKEIMEIIYKGMV